jgi:hypothetical protein
VVKVMKEADIGSQTEVRLAEHQAERAFLVGRCDAGFLTPDQTVAILYHIHYLDDECRVLRWMLRLPTYEIGETFKATLAT